MKIYKTQQKDTIDLCNFKSYLSLLDDFNKNKKDKKKIKSNKNK